MTISKVIRMFDAKLHCLERDVSGSDPDCNSKRCDSCSLNYEMGNMGQQKEAYALAIEVLKDHIFHF